LTFRILLPALCAVFLLLSGCGGPPPEDVDPERFRVPPGAGVIVVADTLEARGIVSNAFLFRLYARFRGQDRPVQAGVYEIPPGTAWSEILDHLVEGRVLTQRINVPEGWTIMQIGERLAAATNTPTDSVLELLADSTLVEEWNVPGPTFEGYLYPATYTFPVGTEVEAIVRGMVDRYRAAWTPELRARADSLGLSEREVVTLASIIEKEARVWEERDTISAVYNNRLRRGMRLQADPTVQYALGEHQTRLLYQHIDDVADNPYNTYTHAGLPPGPIASPSVGAIRAALNPADVDYLFMVARPDGTHIFTRNFDEHRAARARLRREAQRQQTDD